MMNTTDCLANRRFLVVDDESFIRTLIARYLKRSGAAEVVEAADGGQAIAVIASHDMTFDAVISDVNMHPVNGIELLRAIRTGSRGLKRNTPVLMLTVHAEAELVADALALDADAFVLKPVEREALIERVLRALKHTVPIGPGATYAAVGSAGAAAVRERVPVTIGPAPTFKRLEVSEAALATTVHGGRMPSSRALLTAEPVAVAHKIALADVQANSILAKDIYVANTSTLLLAAPSILTQAVLDRLTDLHHIHDSYSHVVVIEPR
jgi:CheY-like chemotaxis protein